MEYRGHGVALFSGGLDSALAILLILKQNIRVTALSFMTHFGCDITDKSSCSKDPYPMAEQFGFEVKMVHLGDKFVQIVREPKYGHGKNMNPCIDCRILMLGEAKHYMEIAGADFVFTGEVVGQRPMSQHKPQMDLIKRDSDLGGKLVRPLSAKILPPTEPELSGLLDREKLEGISGRSRRRQIELAAEFGLEEFPSPAAGCLLTDREYSKRLRDYFAYNSFVEFNDLNLLRVGRHFRVSDKTKFIVGRHHEDNAKIERYRKQSDWIFEALGTGSPLTLLKGECTEENIANAAAVTARYCDKKQEAEVEVSFYQGKQENLKKIKVAPAENNYLDTIRI